REALQLLRTIRKAELKLERRGLFRPKPARRRKKRETEPVAARDGNAAELATSAAAKAMPNGHAAGQPAGTEGPTARPAEAVKKERKTAEQSERKRGALKTVRQLLPLRTGGKRASSDKTEPKPKTVPPPPPPQQQSEPKPAPMVSAPPLPLQPRGSSQPGKTPAAEAGTSVGRPSNGQARTQPPPTPHPTRPPQQPPHAAPKGAPPPRPSRIVPPQPVGQGQPPPVPPGQSRTAPHVPPTEPGRAAPTGVQQATRPQA